MYGTAVKAAAQYGPSLVRAVASGVATEAVMQAAGGAVEQAKEWKDEAMSYVTGHLSTTSKGAKTVKQDSELHSTVVGAFYKAIGIGSDVKRFEKLDDLIKNVVNVKHNRLLILVAALLDYGWLEPAKLAIKVATESGIAEQFVEAAKKMTEEYVADYSNQKLEIVVPQAKAVDTTAMDQMVINDLKTICSVLGVRSSDVAKLVAALSRLTPGNITSVLDKRQIYG